MAAIEGGRSTSPRFRDNRIDYALDFVTERFEPRVEQFVAHSNCKVAPHWSAKDTDDTLPSPVYRGRRIETVTIGKMPGRQITVYDKRRDSIVKQKYWWFKVWGLDRHDKSHEVWRVEVRAGKKELKDKWNLRHLSDVKDAIGDVYAQALEDIRYLADNQSDGNVTRQSLHPLWIAAQTALEASPDTTRAGLLPGQVKEVERQKAIDTAITLILGNACSYAAAQGWSPNEARERLPVHMDRVFRTLVNSRSEFFEQKMKRALESKRFIQR